MRMLRPDERVVADVPMTAKRVSSNADPDVWAMVVDPGGHLFVTVHVRDDRGVRVAGSVENKYSDRGPAADWTNAMHQAERLVAEQVDMRAERARKGE